MHHAESMRGLRDRLRVVAAAALALVLIGASPPPRRVPRAPAPAAPEETDEAMLARFAAAMTTGEARGLGNFIVPEEAEDEELLGAFVSALRAVCGSPGAFRLVSFARIAPDKIFACFFAGRPAAAKDRGPLMLVFEKLDARWKTSLLDQIKSVGAKDADVAARVRRGFARRVMGLRFGSLTLSQFAALLNASADACAALAEPPYDLPFGSEAVESMRKQAQQALGFAGRPWADIEKTLIAEAGEDCLPELGDFQLGLYLEAGEGTREREIPYAAKEGGFAAERLPFLTGEDVLRARVDAGGESGERGVCVTLSSQGAAILTNVALGCSGRRFAIVLDGKVIATPVIGSALASGELVIAAGFSAEEASTIAARLNAYRAEALARFKEIEGEHAGEQPRIDIARAGDRYRFALSAGGREVLRAPPEGLWSIAFEWKDSWPAGFVHADPTAVEQAGEWTLLSGKIEAAGGAWELRDAYRVKGNLVQGVRRFTWRGASPCRTATLSVRFHVPAAAGVQVVLPGILYNGNPSGARSGRVPVFGGTPGEVALFEEHRYPLPFASVEYEAGGARRGAAMHSLPSEVPYGNLNDQWWSLGAAGIENGIELALLSGPCASNGRKSVIKAIQPGFIPYDRAWIDVPPGAVIEKTFFLEVFPVAAEGAGFSRPLRSSIELFAPFDESRFPSIGEILRAKLAYARTRWIERGEAAGFSKYPDRPFFVMGWCGQAESLGYALQVLAPDLGEPRAQEWVRRSLDFLARSELRGGQSDIHTLHFIFRLGGFGIPGGDGDNADD